MASQRQAHNRKRQKAILVMAVALLIIVVDRDHRTDHFFEKIFGFQGSYRITGKYYKLEQGGRNVCRFRQ